MQYAEKNFYSLLMTDKCWIISCRYRHCGLQLAWCVSLLNRLSIFTLTRLWVDVYQWTIMISLYVA